MKPSKVIEMAMWPSRKVSEVPLAHQPSELPHKLHVRASTYGLSGDRGVLAEREPHMEAVDTFIRLSITYNVF